MKFLKSAPITFLLLLGLGTQIASAQQMRERTMTVQELADSLKANNIQLKIAKTNVLLADAKIAEVKTNYLPNIKTEMIGMYLSDVGVYDKHWNKLQEVDIPNFGHQFNVSANQLIFGGGRINKSVDLAKLNKSLSENQFTDIDQGVKLNAVQLYLNLYNLQNQKKILINNKALAQERVKNIQDFFNQDMVTKNEVLRAEVLSRQLTQAILRVQNAIEITNKSLILLTGLDANTLIVPDVSNIKHEVKQQQEADFLASGYLNNPRLKISDTQISMAKKNLDITKSEKLPTLAGFTGYNATRPMTSTSPALDGYSNSYQIGLNLSYNIESLFKNKKKVAVNKILIDQAELSRIAVKQQIDADVNSAYKSYHEAIEQRKVSVINEEAAAENYRITELKYKNQLVTLTEIIDASNTKLQAELQTLDDNTNVILNYVRLLRVSGQL